MTDEDFIKLAIEEARNSQKAGGAPIGAVMVKNGQVVAKGWSMVWPEKDPTSHAETNCIKESYKMFQGDLKDCTLYSTLEPCSMCLGCASWAGLSKIFFGAYYEDIQPNPYEISDYHAEQWAKKLTPPNGVKVNIIGGVLRNECADLMKKIKNWTPI